MTVTGQGIKGGSAPHPPVMRALLDVKMLRRRITLSLLYLSEGGQVVGKMTADASDE